MQGNIELELKTLITKEQFEKLTSFYQPLNFVKQHNHYYVTDNLNSYAFRVRTIGDKNVFTLKYYLNGDTHEYEKEFDGNFEDDPEILDLLNQFNVKPPYRMFGELITERAVVESEFAELCFDINSYNGLIDYELEYEVHKDHDHHAAFNEILKKADIEYVPSYASKYKRCLLTIKKETED